MTYGAKGVASIVKILRRGRNGTPGSPRGVCVIFAALLALVVSACTDTHSATPTLSTTPPVSAATAVSPKARLGVDQRIPLRAWWNLTKVTRTGDEAFQAQLSPADAAVGNAPRYVQLTGLGFPYVGSHDGRRYTGPGVDQHWDYDNNEYQVSFRFTGERLGLSVLSTGGRWRVLVDGAVVGGGAPRSAGSASAYHVLDVDFSGAGGARSRTITVQLSGGAWLSGIGTDQASDSLSPPAGVGSPHPSVYWLGDSYVVGAGARYPGFDDLVHVASRYAGLSNVTVDALGGTGYARANAAAKFPDYLDRARLNLHAGRATPDLIVVGGSINDDIYTEEHVRSAAAALFAYLARAEPKAKVLVVPFTDAYPVPGPVQHAIDGVLAAAHAAPNVAGVLDLPAQVLAHRGNRSVGRFSSTLASTTIPYHPSPAAHQLYGRLIGQFIAGIVHRQRSANAKAG